MSFDVTDSSGTTHKLGTKKARADVVRGYLCNDCKDEVGNDADEAACLGTSCGSGLNLSETEADNTGTL